MPPDPRAQESAPPARAGRAARIALRAGLALLLGLLLLEGSLRFLLFSDLAPARLSAPLRKPGFWASRFSGRQYWKLAALFADGPEVRPSFDARFGWLKDGIDPLTLRHADEQELAGRRPVLLYGDSFGECLVDPTDCWQGLLERSPLSGEYRLLNYAVRGYGLDQMLILLRATVDLYAELRPVVVVGIQVEDDVDRCWLALRDYPKPYFTLRGDELVAHPVEHASRREHVRADPVGIGSYAWRLLLMHSGFVRAARVPAWTGEDGHVKAKRELGRRILAEMQRELSSRGLPFFFVLFHGREAAEFRGTYPWQEAFLLAEFETGALPFVSAKRFLLESSRASGAPLAGFFIPDGPGANHYTAAGNAVVFEALRQGLEGRFEAHDGRDARASARPAVDHR